MKLGRYNINSPLRNLSLSNRIAALNLGSAIFIASICVIISLVLDKLSFDGFQRTHLETLSNVLSHTSVAALKFSDRDAAMEDILAFEHEKDLEAVHLFEATGELFVSYSITKEQPSRLNFENMGIVGKGEILKNTFPIQFNDRIVGYGIIEISNQRILEQSRRKTFWTLWAIPIAILIATLLSKRIRFRVTDPISELSSISKKVSEHKNYALRAQKRCDDEVGELVDHYNDMLIQIEDQERQLHDANRFLENQVHERTKDLVATALHAQKALETKGRFLSTMSHELRTPMNAVIGMSSLLKTEGLDEESLECIEIIKTSSIHLGSMIDDILDFSKIESGKLELEKHTFSLQNCLEDAMDVCSHRYEKHEIQTILDINGALPENLVGDEIRLRQIMINLIGNAIKFTEEGFVSVMARKIFSSKGPKILKIAVSDSGIGIPEEKIGQLFSDFVQADSSTTRNYGGTGLGLAISKQLTEAMGGSIHVKSEEGKGSDFWIEIPFVESTEVVSSVSFSPEKLSYFKKGLPAQISLKLDQYCLSLGIRSFDSKAMKTGPVFEFRSALGRDPLRVLAKMESETIGAYPQLIYICTPALERKIKQQDDSIKTLTVPFTRSKLCAVLESIPQELYEESMLTESSSFPKLKNRKILLAEDNRMNTKVVTMMLERMGLEVECVSNGRMACEKFQNDYYDLVLMDYQMPVMDGLQATLKIREMDLVEQPWIIALTANVEEEISKNFFKAGVQSYVSKPIVKTKLVKALAQFESLLEIA